MERKQILSGSLRKPKILKERQMNTPIIMICKICFIIINGIINGDYIQVAFPAFVT